MDFKMKKFTYIFFMLFAVLFSACNSEDFDYDIEYTPIHPIGGQYRVSIVDETGTEGVAVDCARDGLDSDTNETYCHSC